jgi:hypothetical protein
MKRPLAVALLLASWYLVTPPYSQPGKLDSKAALSKWGMIAYYGSSAACEADRQNMIKASGASSDSSKLLSAAQCVEENDPRLK